MANSFSNLVNNFAQGIHKIKSKYGHDNRKCETSVIKYRDCNSFPEYANFKDNLTLVRVSFLGVRFVRFMLET